MRIDELLNSLKDVIFRCKENDIAAELSSKFDAIQEKVALFKQSEDIIEIINNALATNMDLDDFYQLVCDQLHTIIDWDRVSIAIFEEASGIVTAFVLTKGYKTRIFPEERNYAYKGSILEKIMETCKPVIVNDTSKNSLETDRIHYKEGTLSRLAYPLEFNGKVVGSINFSSKKRDTFNENHFEILRKITPTLAFLVDNNLEREIIGNINNVIASDFKPDDLYQEVCDELYKLIDWDRVSIAIFKQASGIITAFMITKGYKTKAFQEKRNYSYKGSILEKVMISEEPVIITDTADNILETDKIHYKEGIRSRMAYPLKFSGEIIGSINFSSKKVNNFTKKHYKILGQIAPILAFMVENNKLFMQASKCQKEYKELTKTIDTPWL